MRTLDIVEEDKTDQSVRKEVVIRDIDCRKIHENVMDECHQSVNFSTACQMLISQSEMSRKEESGQLDMHDNQQFLEETSQGHWM